MKLPKVSIIIPVYNGSEYLTQAIDSALAQTYKNFEVIVVNDGSQDNGETESIAKSYGSKIRYIKKRNGGVSSALNTGIQKAKGDWISWLSHDDMYLPDKLEKQIAYTLKYPKVRFIYSDYKNINESSKEENHIHAWIPNKTVPLFIQLLERNPINGCTTLIHRSCFKTVGLFNESNKTAQDYEMWIKLSFKYSFHHCPIVAVIRRVHGQMGSILLSSQQLLDIENTIKQSNTSLSIEAIATLLKKEEISKELAGYLIQLGDVYEKQGLSNLAKTRYKEALKLNSSLKPTVITRLLLGRLFFPKTLLVKSYWKALALKKQLTDSLPLPSLKLK